MKSKRQIINHLGSVGYTKRAAYKILGFLKALEEVEIGEDIYFHKAEVDEQAMTFEDFVEWYDDETEENEVFVSLLEDLMELQKEALDEGDNETFERVNKQIWFLLDNFEIELGEEEEEESEGDNE